MKPRKFRFLRRPSTATVLALLALALSVGQLFFSAPLLTRYYFRPDIVVSGPGVDWKSLKDFEQTIKDRMALTNFDVSNLGNTAATKIEIGFVIAEYQKVTLRPAIAANITLEDDGHVKTARVQVEHLSAGERFSVEVSPGSTPKKAELKGEGIKFGTLLPMFSFVRSAEGPGRFLAVERQAAPKR